jgi:hypothetical protein
MRYRLMASFQGASYQAGVGPSDDEVTLFAACPPPEELGFHSSAGHWRKRVSVEEIDALWESRPIGRYRGERCMVLDDLGDRLHICYLGHDLYMARRLGFWEVDRGVFEVVVPRQEIEDLREERGEFELAILDPADEEAPGGWNSGARDTWESPDGRQRNLIDTGPSWAADPDAAYDVGPWQGRDANAQDPRDTGTWAAVRDQDLRDSAEPGGPYVRGRGGWRARDTGGWEAPDTGSWDAREVAERAAREARDMSGIGGWDARDMSDTGGWAARDVTDRAAREGRDTSGTGGWAARDVTGRAAREPRDMSDTGSWDARDMGGAGGRAARDAGGRPPRDARDLADTASWDVRDLADTGSWNAHDVAGTGSWHARDMNGSGSWPARDVTDRDPRDTSGGGGWAAREDSGGWDAREVVPYNRRDAAGWDPQDTVAWDPASEWGQGQVIRSPHPHQTPDAAAVWHGSPAPEDVGIWDAMPPAGPAPVTNREGYMWAEPAPAEVPPLPYAPPADAPGAGAAPPPDAMPGNGATAGTAAAGAGTAADPTTEPAQSAQSGQSGQSGQPGPSVQAADPRETATPNEYAAMVGRSVGRRSARKPRVTTQAIFSQLLDLASIPQSAYAVDDEVDGAMCLIRTKDGYEVFSASDHARHEVRYFEDEEAAYFYLFGILAAEAVRSGHLGPKTSPQRALEPPSPRQQQR